MKKIYSLVLLFFSTILLVACQSHQTTTSSSSSEEHLVQLVVKTDKNTTDEKVSFTQGDTVMDLLKANYDVEETDGFITAIDGVQQDEKAGKYWMFDVNDELAPKSADQIKIQDGDKIEFYQEVYKN